MSSKHVRSPEYLRFEHVHAPQPMQPRIMQQPRVDTTPAPVPLNDAGAPQRQILRSILKAVQK